MAYDKNKNTGENKSKHSGSASGVGKAGPWVNGWNYSKRDGMTKIFCHRYKGSHTGTSKIGKRWEVWIAQITVGKNEPYIQPCLHYPDTGRVIINSLGFVLNPKAPNKGYCGTFSK